MKREEQSTIARNRFRRCNGGQGWDPGGSQVTHSLLHVFSSVGPIYMVGGKESPMGYGCVGGMNIL